MAENDVVNTQELDTSKLIGCTVYSVEWLLEYLNKFDEKFASLRKQGKVTKFLFEDIGKNNGCISNVYLISIEFANVNEKYDFAWKVPKVETVNQMAGTEGKEKEQAIAALHNRECDFYQTFTLQIPIPFPKIQSVYKWIVDEQYGFIMMESFFGKAKSVPMFSGATPQQLFELVKHLAHFHAYFLYSPSYQWSGQYGTETLEPMAKTDFFTPAFKILKERKPGVFDKAIDTFGPYAKHYKFIMYMHCGVYKDLGLPPVLTHGDMWTNNVLWKLNPDGSLSSELAAIIDWQMVHEGCMTNDLAGFVAMSVDAEVRREYEFQVLQLYYDTIVSVLKEKGKEVNFTFEQVKKAYKTNFVTQAMTTMAMGPFFFPNLTSDQSDYKVKQAQQEKVFLRAQCAAEDALTYFKDMDLGNFVLD
ncbi:hypothetical protein L596_023365 [Steinernema carpocapsae]|uniref:CHK kinase-like domain-containing protein n=1 Tax=Steinernema carpocapsae TaxID=34508 RepID=A0A4U5MDH2_STECR|nr:hypothetical protein L596_023365 [Steinernema carpocapsae]